MTKKQQEKIKDIMSKLEQIRQTALMNTAYFEAGEHIDIKADQEITAFIKQKTEIWRESWIIYPLFEQITELNKLREGKI